MRRKKRREKGLIHKEINMVMEYRRMDGWRDVMEGVIAKLKI